MKLDDARFLEVIKNTPLVSIDLIIRNFKGEVLMGLRKNEPAKDTWFVPGGRVRKGETLDIAFERITEDELGQRLDRKGARLFGVFDTIYETNYLGEEGIGTHYVVIVYELSATVDSRRLPVDQHREYHWFSRAEALNGTSGRQVHPNNHPYLSSY